MFAKQRKGNPMNPLKRLAALAILLVFTLTMALTGCSGAATVASSSSSSSEPSESASSTSAESKPVLELVGKPWVSSTLSGNLPPQAPEAKDDLYLHFNYDYLASHEGENKAAMTDRADEIKDTVIDAVKDGSKTSHDLEQLRIFYNQAADLDTVVATGYSDIQPYLDRIDAVRSIDEMNALLAANDFPFSPFVLANVKTVDTRTENVVGISPDFVFCDALIDGGTYYHDYEDPQTQEAMETMLEGYATYTLIDLISMGKNQQLATLTIRQIMQFEKEHGKHLEAQDTFLKKDFGELSQAVRDSYCTLDELCALCPNFPMRETLVKLGKDGSPLYTVTREWLEAFNGLWTQDNLEAIKEAAKANIVAETRSLHDPSFMNQVLALSGEEVLDADAFAYQACDDNNTLAQVLAKVYVDEKLGPEAKTRLESLSKELVDEYKELIRDTAWMSEEAKSRVIEKLDHVTLNILEPVSGYFDYSGLELTPTEQGGTLLSNYLKLKQYRYDCEKKMIGQRAAPASTWYAVEPTIMNAFYDPESNSINIFPGFVTSLVYDDSMSDDELLARLGWTIAHEISHGFDYQGAQLDAYGQPNPLFEDADVDKFVTKCSALALYFQGIEMEPGHMVDGKAVVGEAAADLSGMQVILEVLHNRSGVDYAKFFENASLIWAQVMPVEYFPLYAADVHPLSNLRVNVSSQMFKDFYDAFNVSEGDVMYLAPDERIVIWGPDA